MTSLSLLLCGLLAAMTFTSGVSSDVTSQRLRHIRESVSRHMRALQAQAAEKRFVGQLATDCGMDCKREQETGAQAKRVEGSKLVEALRKRFMSLGASDCGSFECVQKKRNAQEEIKRLLAGKDQKRSAGPSEALNRHKDYYGAALGGGDYGGGSSSNSYGSNGWKRSAGPSEGLSRHKDYFGSVIAGGDYGGGSYGSSNSYGSNGWDSYGSPKNNYYEYDDEDQEYYDDEEEQEQDEERK